MSCVALTLQDAGRSRLLRRQLPSGRPLFPLSLAVAAPANYEARQENLLPSAPFTLHSILIMAWLMAAVGVIMVPHRFMTWTAFQRIGLLLAVTAYALVYPLQKLGPIPYFIVVAFDISVLIAIGHLLHARIGLAFLLIFFRVLYWPSPNDPNLHDLADFFFATSREFPLIAISLPIWASRHLPSVLETATWLDSADEPAVSGSEDR